MLIRMLQSLGRRPEQRKDPPPASTEASPRHRIAVLDRAHGRAPVRQHLEVLYGALRIGSFSLNELVQRCLSDSSTELPPSKILHRPLASYFLAQYFVHSLRIEADRAECGVLNGTSALLLCRAAQAYEPDYTGSGLHLVDSFEGLAQPRPEDSFAVETDGQPATATIKRGSFYAPIEHARTALEDFPDVAFHKGWIPEVFDALPASRWAFVHLDVDQYDPTYAGLSYFYPRLSPGGVIICDDYGAPLFPGAHRAWDRFCEEHDVPYVVLDTGQSVILKA
jgi:O-methyltransferase